MNNTPLSSMAFGFDHIFRFLSMLTARYKKYSGVNFCTQMPFIHCWTCTERQIHQTTGRFSSHQHSHEDISKQIENIPCMWSQERFGGSTSTWYVQVLLPVLLDTSDGDIPEMIWMHLFEF